MNEEALGILIETINVEYEDHKRDPSEEKLVRMMAASSVLYRHLKRTIESNHR